MSQPQLTDLPTVGEHTAQALAEHGFHSVADLAAATIEKLSAVPGFSDARAVAIRQAAVQLLEQQPGAETPTPKETSIKKDEKKMKKDETKKKDKKDKKKDKKKKADKKDKKDKKKKADKKGKKKADKKGKKKDGKKKKK